LQEVREVLRIAKGSFESKGHTGTPSSHPLQFRRVEIVRDEVPNSALERTGAVATSKLRRVGSNFFVHEEPAAPV
jgi:hypothetical protein